MCECVCFEEENRMFEEWGKKKVCVYLCKIHIAPNQACKGVHLYMCIFI